ncbi:recombination regulator RecX [Pediococcus stilesii]|uniref:recombination regulator RecX n=1 Tax=Pediococcus stilesii TaxID=331679 RepID=UPI0022A8D84E|nr:recombination regulator RecX [Pediococcus stilesii]
MTLISAQKCAGRYNVFLDGEYAFPISEDTFIHFRLNKGMEIDGPLLQAIGEYETGAEAYNKALNFLTGQLRTQDEVAQKLLKLEFDEEVVAQVLAKLAKLNLLNDAEYAKSYVRTMMHTGDKGPRYIINHLRQKGVYENDIQTGLDLFTEEEQISLATTVGQKIQKRLSNVSIKQQQMKIRQNLMNKGFNGQSIDVALQEIDFEVDEEAEYEKLLKLGERLIRKYGSLPDYSKKAKIKQALFTKGFEMNLIEKFISENEI